MTKRHISTIAFLILTIASMLTVSIVHALSFNDLTGYQKQKYWNYIKECQPLLEAKKYKEYRTCALNALKKAANEEESQAWCNDSDNGADFFTKSVVTSDIYPNGREDYSYTFKNGKTYVIEGMCDSNNQYYYIQKNCTELGTNYKAENGICADANNAPMFNPIPEQKVKVLQEVKFNVSAVDPDGDNLSYSVEDLPIGGNFENQTFHWIPDYNQTGEYKVKFIVSDGYIENYLIVSISSAPPSPQETLWTLNMNVDQIEEREDGGFLLIDLGQNMNVKKINKGGTLEWEKLFQLSQTGCKLESAVSTKDGYAVVGSQQMPGTDTKLSQSHGCFLQLDKEGNVLKEKTYGPDVIPIENVYEEEKYFSFDLGLYQIASANEGFMTGGILSVSGYSTLSLLAKIDLEGNLTWHKIFGDVKKYGPQEFKEIRDLSRNSNGLYAVVGLQGTGMFDIQGWTVLVTEDGNIEYESQIKQEEWPISSYFSVLPVQGGFIANGRMTNWGSITKFNNLGVKVWEKYYGYEPDYGSNVSSICTDKNDNLIFSGRKDYLKNGVITTGKILVKIDSEGNTVWEKDMDLEFKHLKAVSIGGYILASDSKIIRMAE